MMRWYSRYRWENEFSSAFVGDFVSLHRAGVRFFLVPQGPCAETLDSETLNFDHGGVFFWPFARIALDKWGALGSIRWLRTQLKFPASFETLVRFCCIVRHYYGSYCSPCKLIDSLESYFYFSSTSNYRKGTPKLTGRHLFSCVVNRHSALIKYESLFRVIHNIRGRYQADVQRLFFFLR